MSFAKLIYAFHLAVLLPVAAQAFELQSSAPGFAVTARSDIAANPAASDALTSCHPASDDFSASGALIAAAGWIVTSEVAFEGFELVGFAKTVEEQADGGCDFGDGAVAIWRDGAFLGLIENAASDTPLVGAVFPAKEGVVPIHGPAMSQVTGGIHYDAAKDSLIVEAR